MHAYHVLRSVKKLTKELRELKPVRSGDSDLFIAMKQVSETGKGPEEQFPSMGCGIKWSSN